MFTFAEKLKQMSNIEHKDVGVSSLKGTPSRKIYIKTSTEAVYNPEGVTQEYINNHVDGSKIVNGTVTTGKIADAAVTMGKLDNEVQTEIQRGTQRAWNPKGTYNENTVYGVNDLVYHTDANSSYISLQANNQGHNPAWQSATGGWWMKVVDGSYVNVMVEELEQAIAQAIEDAQEDISELISDSQATINAAVSGANSAAQAANTAAANADAKIDWVEEQVDSLTAYEVATALDETSIIPVQNKVVTEAIRSIEEIVQKDTSDVSILKDAHFRLHQDAVKRNNIVDININKEQMLLAMSRHINIPTSFTTSSKRLTLAWCSDVHSDLERWARFVDYCNYYKDILDAAIVTGDLNQTWDFDMGWEMLMDYAKEHLEIPIIPVIGNHDASGDKVSGHNALASGSVDWLGENYITPYIDEDCVQGEKDGVKQAYFYRDFAAPKIRVISINDYDMPRWAGFSYFTSPSQNDDLSTAINATNGMSLTTGNIYTYRGLYFKVTQTVTFGCARTFPRTNWFGGQYTFPFSHTGIWGRYISQAQADFLVDALNSVPSGYNVIIASHLLLDNTRGGVAADEKWHCRNANSNMGIAYCQNGYILQDILSAYMNKTTLSKSYAPQVENASAGGGASLASDWRYPTVTVEADFSSAQGSVICQLAGHLHEDVAIWSGRMTDAELLLIGAPSNCYHAWLENESNGAWQCGDIYKGENKPDIFNVISFDTTDKAIQLLRIGADMTDRMEERVSTRISYINN